MLVAVYRPVGGIWIITRWSPDLFGFTDATSNAGLAAPVTPPGEGAAGDDCAWMRGIVAMPAESVSIRLVHAAVRRADLFMDNVSFGRPARTVGSHERPAPGVGLPPDSTRR